MAADFRDDDLPDRWWKRCAQHPSSWDSSSSTWGEERSLSGATSCRGTAPRCPTLIDDTTAAEGRRHAL